MSIDKLVKEYYVSKGFEKDYKFEDFKFICSFPFRYLIDRMRDIDQVRFMGFGTFVPSKGKLGSHMKLKEMYFKNGYISEEDFDYYKKRVGQLEFRYTKRNDKKKEV